MLVNFPFRGLEMDDFDITILALRCAASPQPQDRKSLSFVSYQGAKGVRCQNARVSSDPALHNSSCAMEQSCYCRGI